MRLKDPHPAAVAMNPGPASTSAAEQPGPTERPPSESGTGTLLKTGVFEGFKEIAGHPISTRLTLTDAIRKDRKSVLDYGEVVVRDLPDKYFDKNYMKTLD